MQTEVKNRTSSVRKSEVRDFRSLLQEELVERCRHNPNYSLRSFAKSLQIEPSALSQIINGKRPITNKMKIRLGTAMEMSIQEISRIPVNEKQKNGSVEVQFQQITLDAFSVISDWYHYAILELTYIEGFKSDPGWIARKLGITKSEANIAIERLLRLELLILTSDGQLKDASENGNLTHLVADMSAAAARKYQCQLLELSGRAVKEILSDERNHTSATFCFDKSDLKSAVDKISSFRRSFAKTYQPKQKANSVYQLQISFFPLTN